MEDCTILDLAFKGERNYLRAGDIHTALVKLAWDRFGPQAEVNSLTIRRPFRHAIQVSFEPSAEFSGSFRVRHDAESIPGWLRDTGNPVARRIPYDTSPLPAAAVSGPGFARIMEPLPGFAALDTVVCMSKLVAQQTSPRHWWLCRLNLDSPLTETCPIEVRMLQNLGGQFLVLEIVQGGLAIGTLHCILDGANCKEAAHGPTN